MQWAYRATCDIIGSPSSS